MKILMIEDSPEIGEAASICIETRWPDCEIVVSAEGARGLDLLKDRNFNLLILDINLPDIDGFTILKKVRSFSDIPIIMMTVRRSEHDQALCFEIGADDYIVKPFRPRDLTDRVNAVLRRQRSTSNFVEKTIITRGEFVLNTSNNEVQKGGKIIKLTPIETKLLYILMENSDNKISGNELIRDVWEREMPDITLLQKYISRLRNKLEDNSDIVFITDSGESYKFSISSKGTDTVG